MAKLITFENVKGGRVNLFSENEYNVKRLFESALNEWKDFPDFITYEKQENDKEVQHAFTKNEFTRLFIFEK